jgi:hypothetical protein
MAKNLFIHDGYVYEDEEADKYRSITKEKKIVDDLNKKCPHQVVKTLVIPDDDNAKQNISDEMV